MIRVGAVNIDTSHPMGFGDSMKKDGRMKYVGVYNDSFRSNEEVDGFIARYGLERRCDTLEELAGMCDIGFIQGCDWDDHLRCAQPFIQMGKPVFLDKPAVGREADCQKVRELVRQGAAIIGSSSARYAYEIQEFLKIPQEERGEIVTVIGTSGVDEFNYGIHIAEILGGLLGQGAQAVQYMGQGQAQGSVSETYFVRFENGKSGIYTTLTGAWQPFAVIVITTKNTYELKLDSTRLYDALIEQIANYMEGKPHILAPAGAILESVEIMLAGSASRSKGGVLVPLNTLDGTDGAFDGPEFWKKYSAASGAMYAYFESPSPRAI